MPTGVKGSVDATRDEVGEVDGLPQVLLPLPLEEPGYRQERVDESLERVPVQLYVACTLRS